MGRTGGCIQRTATRPDFFVRFSRVRVLRWAMRWCANFFRVIGWGLAVGMPTMAALGVHWLLAFWAGWPFAALWSAALIAGWSVDRILAGRAVWWARAVLGLALVQAYWQVRSLWY